jgi:DNA-binding transcriptional ArsR family regulator
MNVFEPLAEPARLRLVEILASGEHTAGQLADVVGWEFRISRTAVSKHLRHLRNAHYVEVRAELQWRWYRLNPLGFAVLEGTVAELRHKVDTAIGWNADKGEKYDPLGSFSPTVAFKGPGREPNRGRRGQRTAFAPSREPDLGLYPVYPLPPEDD